MYADSKKYMYGKDFPFKDNPGILASGSVESVNNITRQDVQDYLTNTFTIDNCVLTIVGNISLSKIKKLIEKHVIKGLLPPNNKEYHHRDEFSDYNNKPVFNISPSPEQDRSQIVICGHYNFGKIDRLLSRVAALIRENFYTSAKQYFRDKFGLCYSQSLTFGNSTYNKQNKQYGFYEICINCDKSNIAKVLEVLPEFYSFLQNYKIDKDKLAELQTKIRRFEKCGSVRTYKQIGNDLSRQYFDKGHIYTKKENKLYKKQADKISLDYVNEYLYKVLTCKPYILIVSNTSAKLPEYNKLCKDIKKNLKWCQQEQDNLDSKK